MLSTITLGKTRRDASGKSAVGAASKKIRYFFQRNFRASAPYEFSTYFPRYYAANFQRNFRLAAP
jgi:hypothetical protein